MRIGFLIVASMLAFAACTDDTVAPGGADASIDLKMSGGNDMTSSNIDMHAMMTSCSATLTCVTGCQSAANQTVCAGMCAANATPKAQMLLGVLNQCLTMACPPTDGGTNVQCYLMAIQSACATQFGNCQADM